MYIYIYIYIHTRGPDAAGGLQGPDLGRARASCSATPSKQTIKTNN